MRDEPNVGLKCFTTRSSDAMTVVMEVEIR
jgi:hypothetical protein